VDQLPTGLPFTQNHSTIPRSDDQRVRVTTLTVSTKYDQVECADTRYTC